MKTTKDMVDEDWERLALLDMVFVQEDENEMWRQYLEANQSPKYARIIVGNPVKNSKFGKYARVRSSRKVPLVI